MSVEADQEIIKEANIAKGKSYAPYSQFNVGAAILLESDLSDLGSYDPADDSTIQLIFQNNFEDAGGCDADQYRQVLELTRI